MRSDMQPGDSEPPRSDSGGRHARGDGSTVFREAPSAEDDGLTRSQHQAPADGPASDDSAANLLLRIRAGEEAAFEALFHEYGAMLLALIVRVVRDRTLSEDVLQECFSEVWTRSERFDPARGSGRAWLLTLARRRAIDAVRSSQARRNRDEAEGLRLVHESDPDIAEDVVARIESARTATALSGLPTEQAEAIAMSFYEDLSHAQIAARTRTPLGTVKSRIRDGMRCLRTRLEGDR